VKVVALLAAMLGAVVASGLAAPAASAATFSNDDGITITSPDDNCTVGEEQDEPAAATPYPSEITVDGLDSSVSDVNLTLTGFSHTWPDDVGVLLVGPQGQKTILMSEAGGNSSNAVSGVDLTFDDAASGSLPDAGPLSSGTYQPTSSGTENSSCEVPSSFPDPAPAGPYGPPSLSVFNGTDPNGTWKLYVIDTTSGDNGSITGWSLDISSSTPEDTTPPTVTDTSPDGTASKTATVTATFSEEVQNVTPETFILERNIAVKKAPPKYVLVDATVSLSADGLSAVLDPVQDLPKGEYRATITTDVTDQADPANALEDPVVWFFTVKK
jgi:subtilisin-like proprotein convertase family protein